MFLNEIKDWDKGAKISWLKADKGEYIYLDTEYFIWKDNNNINTNNYDLANDDFIPYKENKEKRKYHLYNIDDGDGWERTLSFLDENGYDTTGYKQYDFNNIKKQKLENEFIEV